MFRIDFNDFIFPFSHYLKFRLRPCIKRARQCFTTSLNNSEFIKKYPLCNFLFGVWKYGKTQSLVCDVSSNEQHFQSRHSCTFQALQTQDKSVKAGKEISKLTSKGQVNNLLV